MGTKMSQCTHCVIIMKNTYLTKYNVIDGVIKVALMLFAFFKEYKQDYTNTNIPTVLLRKQLKRLMPQKSCFHSIPQ